jgi:RNA polymerase sigma factor (sigma-70 family)
MPSISSSDRLSAAASLGRQVGYATIGGYILPGVCMVDETLDDRTLYFACQQDGTDAQAEAFKQLWAYLYRIAYAMLRAQRDPASLASDCTQKALIKIHRSLEQCRNPLVFRDWAAQVTRRVVLDELRRPEFRHILAIDIDDEHAPWLAAPQTLTDVTDLRAILHDLIRHGPLSERSQRVVIGRYFGEQTDEVLARAETERAGQEIRPSHIQVTRAKNLAALRRDPALMERLRELLDS